MGNEQKQKSRVDVLFGWAAPCPERFIADVEVKASEEKPRKRSWWSYGGEGDMFDFYIATGGFGSFYSGGE